MHTLPFVKMHGLGNDYVYIDCFSRETGSYIAKTDIPDLARRISDRHTGVGSDGLVLILPCEGADARMRMFNADGSEAQMCGNAIRCVGKYLYESGLADSEQLVIATSAGLRRLDLRVEKGQVQTVCVEMGIPVVAHNALVLDTTPWEYIDVNMGNPHAVFFSEYMISSQQLYLLGDKISGHPHFKEGTNVEFACVRNDEEIDLRVWERGTGETMACGTGACATVVAAIRKGLTRRNVTVHLPGGDLEICWYGSDQPVYMTGPAATVFKGEYYL